MVVTGDAVRGRDMMTSHRMLLLLLVVHHAGVLLLLVLLRVSLGLLVLSGGHLGSAHHVGSGMRLNGPGVLLLMLGIH